MADEALIRSACEAADYHRAATLTLQLYGADVFGFLAARLRSTSDASEVFSVFSEDLWKGLPKFQWRCSPRTYCYTLARNAANEYCSAPANRAGRRVDLSELDGALSQLVHEVREETARYLRTSSRDKVRALREQLDADEQELLYLRIDRELSWREIAGILVREPEETSDDASLARVEARLRKRFEATKRRLKLLARAEGLL